MKVYCDTGAYSHDLRDMERLGEIEVFQFKYENKNKRIKNIGGVKHQVQHRFIEWRNWVD